MSSGQTAAEPRREPVRLDPRIAGGLVFFVSGAVLVLEILAARLLAPYVGLSLETYTAIIGVVLAGISCGTWLGGRLADAVDPSRILGPIIVLGGLLSLATVPAVRVFGGIAEGRPWYALGIVVVLSFFLPTAVLSASNPLIVKLELRNLADTGKTVGRLSALGTAGAIAGTFLTGFVLLPEFRTSRVVLVLGIALLIAGVAVIALLRRRGRALQIASVVGALLLGVAGAEADDRCQVETAYFCANVKSVDPGDPTRRVLELDSLNHGDVDIDDPKFLGFAYAQRMGQIADTIRPRGPIHALHIGGGGFGLPRYIAATRPGSRNLVLELDPGVVRLAKDRLGLRTGPDIAVRTGDARVAVDDLRSDSYDLVIGDAFSGVAVPWHLATREAAEDVRRALRSRGAYALNIIDHPPQEFLRAEARTLGTVFRYVLLIGHPSFTAGIQGTSNYILLASDSKSVYRRIRARLLRRRPPDGIIDGGALRHFIGDAPLLTDDYAPADQLLTR